MSSRIINLSIKKEVSGQLHAPTALSPGKVWSAPFTFHRPPSLFRRGDSNVILPLSGIETLSSTP
jgi:hypothetical protein